ncbi:hypothetical protein B0T17DRAFT_506870 [Bombardia bombarda]|uniref:Secreted protein n=1 Tax=Bombardia bombarda TaxID=252184 RepID=A0AA39XAL9_9PEZI|nr:hypothetical protein B0T17DRAFT_506870 [Bombardia bombarda]
MMGLVCVPFFFVVAAAAVAAAVVRPIPRLWPCQFRARPMACPPAGRQTLRAKRQGRRLGLDVGVDMLTGCTCAHVYEILTTSLLLVDSGGNPTGIRMPPPHNTACTETGHAQLYATGLDALATCPRMCVPGDKFLSGAFGGSRTCLFLEESSGINDMDFGTINLSKHFYCYKYILHQITPPHPLPNIVENGVLVPRLVFHHRISPGSCIM